MTLPWLSFTRILNSSSSRIAWITSRSNRGLGGACARLPTWGSLARAGQAKVARVASASASATPPVTKTAGRMPEVPYTETVLGSLVAELPIPPAVHTLFDAALGRVRH